MCVESCKPRAQEHASHTSMHETLYCGGSAEYSQLVDWLVGRLVAQPHDCGTQLSCHVPILFPSHVPSCLFPLTTFPNNDWARKFLFADSFDTPLPYCICDSNFLPGTAGIAQPTGKAEPSKAEVR
jgi:hypothetical protein